MALSYIGFSSTMPPFFENPSTQERVVNRATENEIRE
jgi:hypothetical protein